QTAEAFWVSVEHARPLIAGVNCSLGATEMRPFLEGLARIADTYVSCYPNAGLPNAMGEHDEQAADTSRYLRAFAEDGLVNIVGGCCGTTPDHTPAIARAVEGWPPRAGSGIRRRRRADERHRLRALPAPDRSERLPGRRRRRPRAGPRWREPARRQQGRGPARRGAGADALP